MEKDKKAMREKLSLEEEERRQKEEEMKRKMREQQEQSENEIISLYKVLSTNAILWPLFGDYSSLIGHKIDPSKI
jgi:hypothetical protein